MADFDVLSYAGEGKSVSEMMSDIGKFQQQGLDPGYVAADNAVVDHYYENREWAEEQALKQMDYQTSSNREAMAFSADQAAQARFYETELANSAYQRAVKDLKAAGLNPILAYSQGGASVPSVHSASGVSSSGASASMSDTGYTASKANSDNAYKQAELNFKIKKASIDAVTDLAKTMLNTASSVPGNIAKFK